MWNQMMAVIALNLRSVPRRLGSSAVAVPGIAGVVIVVVGILSIARGFQRAMMTGGDPLTAIVLRAGASSETASILGLDSVRLIKEAPGIVFAGTRPIASAEFVMVVNQRQANTRRAMNVTLRGVEPEAFSVRDEIRMVAGRSFQAGRPEAIVGRAAARQFEGFETGGSLRWGGYTWSIVGIFEGDGGRAESEVWCDVAMLQQAFHRELTFQAVYMKLETPRSLGVLRASLNADPRLEVEVRPETEYYADQSRSLTDLITTAGLFIGLIMSAGAIFAAVNTMYTAVASRTREIATLRAIGYGRTAIVCSVLVEAAALAMTECLIGAITAWALIDGYAVSTLNFQSMSQVAFAFAVTPRLIAEGMVSAVGMGLLGALWPAWHGATVQIAAGLREK
jgi:putative ABC transport system permease protein